MDYCRVIGKKQKRKKKRRLLVMIAAAFLLVAALSAAHYVFNIIPIVRRVAEEETRKVATSSVGRAAAETVTDAYSYNDLIQITLDADGNIALLQANSTLIHVLVRTTAARAQANVSGAEVINIRVPLGTLSGLTFLAGAGPPVTLRAKPIGIVSTEVLSEFTSAGINQTLHRIFLRVRADVTYILPGFTGRVSSTTHIPVTESVLVGKVPDFYFSSALFDKTLNLTP